MPLRVIFFGTAELARASLKALAENPEFELLAVITQPDKPRGRELQLQPSPIKALALEKKLPVLQPIKARDPEFIQKVRDLGPDLMVVVAYGQILPQALLDIPRFGCLNVHTSILPRHRGAAPIQWAILSGDTETGVTIMKMDAGLDTGDILTVAKTTIQPEDNAQTLHDRLAQIGAELLLQTIPDYVAGKIIPRPQPEGSTYARKITKEDGRIDWKLSAAEIRNRVRAFTPWPGAFTFYGEPSKKRLLKILEAEPEQGTGQPGAILNADKTGLLIACRDGALRVTMLQREGGRRMNSAEFLAGKALVPGDILG